MPKTMGYLLVNSSDIDARRGEVLGYRKIP